MHTVRLLLFMTVGLLWFGELVKHLANADTAKGLLITRNTPAITYRALNNTPYQLKAIVKTGDSIDGKTLTGFSERLAGLFERLSMNDAGDVAFIGNFQGGKGLFINNRLIAATGETFDGNILTFISEPRLNNSGLVIFRGEHQVQMGNSARLFSQHGVFLKGEFGPPSLNNLGLVALSGPSVVSPVFLISVASPVITQDSLLVPSGGVIGGRNYAEIYGYSLSDSGELAFATPQGIFTQNRFIAAAGDTIGGVTLTGSSTAAPAINDKGEVAFQGFFAEGTGIFTQNAKVIATGDTIDGVNITDINGASGFIFNGPLSINASGEVAFRSSGMVFTQNGIVAKPDDIVDGLALTGIIGNPVINRSGQIAFLASYSGGSVIVLASPNISTGNITVTTNLPNATFTITGPTTFSGSGTSFTRTNVPVGSYTITYGAVQGYSAPPPQTLTLAAGASIRFTGNYMAPNLTVSRVTPVQVVFLQDLVPELVENKATAFRVEIEAIRPDLLSNPTVSVLLQFQGKSYDGTVTFQQSAMQAVASTFINPVPRILPIASIGSQGTEDVIVMVDPQNVINESSEDDNFYYPQSPKVPLKVKVVPTRSLQLAYVGIDRCDRLIPCYDRLTSNYHQTAIQGNKFIMATYPVSEVTFRGPLLPDLFMGSSKTTPGKCSALQLTAGMCSDLDKLAMLVKVSDPLAQHVIGIVPRGYFLYHRALAPNGQPAKGVTPKKTATAVLVEEDNWVGPAHELGHVFMGGPEDHTVPVQGSGYWVTENREITNKDCFMGPFAFQTLDTRWIHQGHYEKLFGILSGAIPDPEILVATMFIGKDSSVELTDSRLLPAGTATQNSPGEYTVRALDSIGRVLSQITMPIFFELILDPGGVVVPMDAMPVLVALPFVSGASSVEVLRQGQVLTRFNPTSRLLNDAIRAIPDFGFDTNPAQRRTALLNKVEAINAMLASGANRGAEQALVNDLRPSIERWLVNGYQKTNPLQMEKAEVLALIDRLVANIQRL
jgi:hypothetical protein